MNKESALAVFENYKIRRVYDDKSETWFFSVVDIVAVLTAQSDYQTAHKYWNKLKERLKKEGSESVTKCHQLKLEAADGKKGGKIAKRARLELEAKTEKSVVTGENFLPPKKATKQIESGAEGETDDE